MINLLNSESKLKGYFDNFLISDEVEDQLKIDWKDFHDKSFNTSRNQKTLEMLKHYSALLSAEQEYISDNVLIVNSLFNIVKDLSENSFIVADRTAYGFIKKHYNLSIDIKHICFIDEITSGKCLSDIIQNIKKSSYFQIVAFGGGKTIDFAKFISLKSNLKLLSIPSSLSTHVYASPKIHALPPIKELGFKGTIDGESSHLSLIDITLIDKLFQTNRRLVLSGFGGIMAFINSRHDWKESSENGNERYSIFVDKSIDFVVSKLETIDISQPLKEWIGDYIFIQCLLCNITDWVGSAPASGAEHLFAKCIEDDVDISPLHGEIVALGVLIFCYLRNRDLKLVLMLLSKFSISTKLSDLGISSEEVINSLSNSRDEGDIKRRYTILNHIDVSRDFFRKVISEMTIKKIIN